jgi:hypothetical protein
MDIAPLWIWHIPQWGRLISGGRVDAGSGTSSFLPVDSSYLDMH